MGYDDKWQASDRQKDWELHQLPPLVSVLCPLCIKVGIPTPTVHLELCIRPSTTPVTSQRCVAGISGMMSGVNSKAMRGSSQLVMSILLASAKLLRQA